jgi:riboflavin transporter FmnP
LIQKSVGGLIFGFATFWAYFYFSQLIVIWYANIPEETGYLVRRIGLHTPYGLMARVIFGMIWMVPFAVLLSRKNKTRAWVTSALAVCVLTGVTMLYWLMLAPVVAVNLPLMAVLTASLVRSSDALFPALAGGQGGAESH